MKFHLGRVKDDFKTYFLVERNNPVPGVFLVMLTLYNSDLSVLEEKESKAFSVGSNYTIPSCNGEFSDEAVSRINKALESRVCEGVGELKDGWTRVEIPDFMSLAMPPTMEIQGGTYKTIKNAITQKVLNFNMDTDTLTMQQSGLNDYLGGSTRRYARIIVKNIKGGRGEFWGMDDVNDLSDEELKELDQENIQEMKQTMATMNAAGVSVKLIRWFPLNIVRFGGGSAIRIAYLRQSGRNPPVMVEQYKLGNNDMLHIVTFSYRQNESDFWKSDFEAVKSSVNFRKR